MFLRLLNYTSIAFMFCKHSRKGVFIETICNIIVFNKISTCIMSLTVTVLLLNLIVLFLAVNVLS
jgi:hypothetical protein